ncbi:hypothetical protein GIB67_011418 [Kingdonia uniflora]|uniref:Cytochrome P450 n=1 Tax=Kingdonia uniflora TaxID=39325 RepID=A0A7J7NLR9_9MAGN|nr:hypothetical protein GIB67_011418 [Kingdonia uniflora]
MLNLPNMSPSMYFTLFLLLFPILPLLTTRRRKLSNKLPPGSLGIPFIGQILDLLRAMTTNTAEEWLEERARKYDPISKLTLFGIPTVFMRGKVANKFVFNNDGEVLGSNQLKSIARIIGSRNILELNGEDHRRERDALLMFFKLEVLKIIRACTKAQSMVMGLSCEKREALLKQQAFSSEDLIHSLLCITSEDNKPALSDKEIVDNVMIVMLAEFDTSSVQLTFLIWLLINDLGLAI